MQQNPPSDTPNEHLMSEYDIPSPSDDLASNTISICMQMADEVEGKQQQASKIINEEISKVFTEIESVDSIVLDSIGAQMEKLSRMYEDAMKSTQLLFKALVNLKNVQARTVAEKKDTTVQILRKIETTIGFISKI